MSPQVAQGICWCFIAWLLYRDAKKHRSVSSALWIPTIWLFILASRPLSVWLGAGGDEIGNLDAAGVGEVSPIDRNFFLIFLVWGLYVLKVRRISWREFGSNNQSLVVLFLYFGLSAVWSDYPIVSLKRWIKDIGNVVMVLIVLTERNRSEAIETLFTRCSALLVPLSVLFVKYYPELGRSYDRWTGRPFYQGVALGKNMLGATLLVSTSFLVWIIVRRTRARTILRDKLDSATVLLLLGMAVWLLNIADSATSLVCTSICCSSIVALDTKLVRAKLHNLMRWVAVVSLALVVLSSLFDFSQAASEMVGRDSTLTGRTDIWRAVLAEDINPLIGEGFYSFWIGERARRLSETYYYTLNEAHNGYIDVYLNSGLIGIGLLGALLIAAGRSLQRNLLLGFDTATICFSFWLSIIVHNWTESSFSRMSPLWFTLLLTIVQYPQPESLVHKGPPKKEA